MKTDKITCKNIFLLILILGLGLCSSCEKVKSEEQINFKSRQLNNYTSLNNRYLETLVEKEYQNIDSNIKTEALSMIHEKQLNLSQRLKNVEKELIAITGGYSNTGASYIGNEKQKEINSYMTGVNNKANGYIIYNELKQYYALFDSVYYPINYLCWKADSNVIYKKGGNRNKNFVELNLSDNNLEELLVTLHLFYHDVLTYEYMELKRRQNTKR